MKNFRWQLLIIFLTGLVVGILLLSEQPEPQQIQAPEPQEGGVYVEGMVGKFQRLNPVLDFYNAADRDIDRLLFDRLIVFGDRGVPEGQLAESWGITIDGTIYTFTLRDDATWHDGKPVTADDIVFTISMLRDGEGIVPDDIREFWQDVEVKNLSDTTLQFLLPEPFAPFLDYLSFGILPEHIYGKMSFDEMVNSSNNLNPIGSGPYKLDGVVSEDGIIQTVVLSVYEDYYGDPGLIEQIVFRYFDTGADAWTAYQDGSIQGISEVDSNILMDVLTDSTISLYTAREPQLSMVLFNLNDQEVQFFQEVEVRKALYYGINRQKIVNQVMNGQAILADGPIFPGTWAYYDDQSQVSYDQEKAIQLLKDAGYVLSGEEATLRTKDEIALRFELLYPDTESHRKQAEMIQADWEKLGVSVEIVGVPYDELITNHLDARDFQAVLVDLNLSNSPDPDPYPFWDQVQATGGQNYSQWDNDVVSDYLEQARTTVDIIERASLYRNFQIVYAEETPAIALYYPVYTFAVSNQVAGVKVGPLFDSSDRFSSISTWYLVTPQKPVSAATPVETVVGEPTEEN